MTGWQAPIENRKAQTYGDFMRIITHPAFRIGFLDAQSGKPCDHDKIIDRIFKETPPNALKRIGWTDGLFTKKGVEEAQYRYEEGRMAVIERGLRCKAWGHPDYPPASLRAYVEARAQTTKPHG